MLTKRTKTEKPELYHLGEPGAFVTETLNVAAKLEHRNEYNRLAAFLDSRTPSMSHLIISNQQTPTPSTPTVRTNPTTTVTTVTTVTTTTTTFPTLEPTSQPTKPTNSPIRPLNCHMRIYADCVANPGCYWNRQVYYGIACQPRKTLVPTGSPLPPSKNPTFNPTFKPTVAKPTTRTPTLKTPAPVETKSPAALPTPERVCSTYQKKDSCLSHSYCQYVWKSLGVFVCQSRGRGPPPTYNGGCISPDEESTSSPIARPTKRPTTLHPTLHPVPTESPTVGAACVTLKTRGNCLNNGCLWLRPTPLSGFVCMYPSAA
jgi:hypothetical protein